jgi:hypothetical protein
MGASSAASICVRIVVVLTYFIRELKIDAFDT